MKTLLRQLLLFLIFHYLFYKCNCFDDDVNGTSPRFKLILRNPDRNNVCIYMECNINISIPYIGPANKQYYLNFSIMYNNSELQNIPQENVNSHHLRLDTLQIPRDSFSYCGENNRRLCLWFWPPPPGEFGVFPPQTWAPWQICWEFTRELDVQEAPDQGWSSVGARPGEVSGSYHLRNMTIYYRWDHPIFNEPNNKTGIHFDSSESDNLFASRVDDYYLCNYGTRIAFKSGVVVSMSQIQIQTFSDKDIVKPVGTPVVCEEDLDNDHTIAYIFLAVILLLLLAVLIGFILGRQRESEANKNSGMAYNYSVMHGSNRC